MLNWNHASPETIRIYFVHALGDGVAENQPSYTAKLPAGGSSYEPDKDLLAVEQGMFKNFRDSDDDVYVRLESTVDVLGCMHENGLNDFLPHFAKAVKVLSIILATTCTPARSFSAGSAL